MTQREPCPHFPAPCTQQCMLQGTFASNTANTPRAPEPETARVFDASFPRTRYDEGSDGSTRARLPGVKPWELKLGQEVLLDSTFFEDGKKATRPRTAEGT